MAEIQFITPEQQRALADATQEQLQKLATEKQAKDIADAVAKAKEETKKEFELAQQLKDRETQTKKLEDTIAEQKKQSETQIAEMKKKIDELSASKAKINFENPFVNASKSSSSQGESPYDKLMKDPELYREVEEKARKAFFGR